MRIESVDAIQPETPGSPPDWRTQLGQILVRIRTKSGLTGWGVGGGGAAGVHVVHTVLRDWLIGRDASDVECLHAGMVRHTALYGRSGLVVMAVSGVDLALWDLRGKAAGKSVAELLSGGAPPRKEIPTYATVFDDEDAREALAAGHRAFKLHVERFGPQPDLRKLVGLVEDTRAALGNEAPVMMDAFTIWDVDTTLAVARSLEPYQLDWLEEPLSPDNLAGYARLASECRIPIAGGEHEYLEAGFRQLVERRLHAVLQPDVNWCGGLTTLIQIYRLAGAAGIRVCPHRGSEPFALPALVTLDPAPLAESPRKWFNCLLGAPRIEAGKIRCSQRPGFGIEVDESLFRAGRL